MKTLLVTGTPGTGKTTLSKLLAKKLNFYYLDVNKIISKYKLSEGYDRKRKTKIIDVNKLNKKLINEIKIIKELNKNNRNKKSDKITGIIIDSHLSHYLPRRYADFCIVTKCDIRELNKRLKKKKFHESKIKENLEAEIFDVCFNEAKERKHKIIAIGTTKGFNINGLIKSLGGK
ncbi:MAG: AAA family ATPase [Nanoarchaeota archaeon]